jgi:integrase
LADLDRGNYTEPTNQTIAEYAADWLEAIRPSLRPSTHHSYAKNLRVHVVPRIGAIPLQSLDAGHLNGLYSRLLVDGHAANGGGLSPRTVRYVHTILHKALADAVAWGRLARNLADAAKPPSMARAASPPPKAWTALQLRHFLESTTADPEWVPWLLLGTTGARRGEILGLRWEDVDLEAATISISHSLTYLAGKITLDAPKTTGSRRRVALDAKTAAILRRHKSRQAAHRLAIGPAWTNEWDLVFTDHLGRPVDPHAFSLRFTRRARALGLPNLSPHGLRHTWASVALAQGVHPKIVQERLGHSSVVITLAIYSHLVGGMDGAAAETVAAQLLP